MKSTELKLIIQNPSTSPEDRASALTALQSLERDATTSIERRDAKKALDSINAAEIAEGDFSQQNIFRLLWDDGVPDMSVEYLRAKYLPEPTTRIEWAWLKFWRDRLKSTSSILREFAECRIKMLAEDANIPGDVWRAAADFMSHFKQRTASDPIPEIIVPNRERWQTMPHEEFYQHLVPHKKSWTDTFYKAR